MAVHHRGAAADHHVLRHLDAADRPSDATRIGCGRNSGAGCSSGWTPSKRSARRCISFELGEALRNPRVWLLTLVYFGQNVSSYGLLIFLPLIVKSFGVSTR